MGKLTRQARSSFFIAISVIAIGAAAAAGFFVLKERERISLEREAQTQARLQKEAELKQNFESLINTFLSDFRDGAREYKRQRSVLKEITKPHNFASQEIADETYRIFQDDIAPSLRKRAIHIMDNFTITEKKVEEALLNEPKETRETLNNEWKKVQEPLVHTYIKFFDLESQLLDAYKTYIDFHRRYAGAIKYDAEKEKLIYPSAPSNREVADDLMQNIERIREEERRLLASD